MLATRQRQEQHPTPQTAQDAPGTADSGTTRERKADVSRTSCGGVIAGCVCGGRGGCPEAPRGVIAGCIRRGHGMRPAHRCLPGVHHRNQATRLPTAPPSANRNQNFKPQHAPPAQAPTSASTHSPQPSPLSLQHPKRRIVHQHPTNPLTGTSPKPRQGQQPRNHDPKPGRQWAPAPGASGSLRCEVLSSLWRALPPPPARLSANVVPR